MRFRTMKLKLRGGVEEVKVENKKNALTKYFS